MLLELSKADRTSYQYVLAAISIADPPAPTLYYTLPEHPFEATPDLEQAAAHWAYSDAVQARKLVPGSSPAPILQRVHWNATVGRWEPVGT